MTDITRQQVVDRLFGYLPPWFADNNPVLNAFLQGAGTVFAFIYNDLLYAQMQTRIATASDEFLDFIGYDFYGDTLLRCPNESDNDYRERILSSLFQERATFSGMFTALQKLTGRDPIIWEAFNGGNNYYNHAYYNHTFAGFNAPYQAWITVYRPLPVVTNTTAFLNNTAFATAESYYGAASQSVSCISDEDILYTIDITKPSGTLMHVTILD